MIVFAGVWRPGSGEQRWRSGMDVDEFKAQDKEFFNKGLRLECLGRFEMDDPDEPTNIPPPSWPDDDFAPEWPDF